MAEMTDAELSLAVARIMYPEYEWHFNGTVYREDADGMLYFFDYRIDILPMNKFRGFD